MSYHFQLFTVATQEKTKRSGYRGTFPRNGEFVFENSLPEKQVVEYHLVITSLKQNINFIKQFCRKKICEDIEKSGRK